MRTRAGCVEIPRRCAARNDTLSARQALRDRMQMIVTIDRAGTARSIAARPIEKSVG